MSGKLFFEIPDDQEVMVKLVEAIPRWAWIDGELEAPGNLISSGLAENNTGFALECFHNIHPTIIGSYDWAIGRRGDPNFFAIMVEQKLPGFVRFDEVGYYDGPITFELAKSIAIGFLQKGYRGQLHFYKGCYGNDKYNNPAYYGMTFESWHGAPILGEEAGTQPARVKLEWDNRYRGKKEDLAPIITACRLLNLREYEPSAAIKSI